MRAALLDGAGCESDRPLPFLWHCLSLQLCFLPLSFSVFAWALNRTQGQRALSLIFRKFDLGAFSGSGAAPCESSALKLQFLLQYMQNEGHR